MAITNSKTVYAPASSTYPYQISVSFAETVNEASNKSTITITGAIYGKNINFSGSTNNTLVIYWFDDNEHKNGTAVATRYVQKTTKGTATNISYNIVVNHKADGSLNGYARVVWTKVGSNSYVPPNTTVNTANTKLTTIPRASVLGTLNDFTIGNTIDIPITKYASTFTDTLEVILNNTTIKTISGITSGYDLTFTEAELNKIYNLMPKTTATFTFKLTTKNGTKVVGTSTKTKTGSINTDTMRPTFPTYTTSEVGDVPSEWGVFVRTKSKIKFVVSSTPSTGSSISNITALIDGQRYEGAEFETEYIQSSGRVQVEIKATDSRGVTSSSVTSINVVDYDAPYITSASAIRSDAGGTLSDTGTYLKVDLVAGVSSVEEKNTAKYEVLYKKTTANEFTTYTFSSTDITYNGYIRIPGFDTNSSYDVKVIVSDYFTSTIKVLPTVSSSFSTLDGLKGGHGLAVGKVAEEEDTFEIAFQTKLIGGLKPIILEENTDLDDVTIQNFYSGGDIPTYGYVNCPLTSGTFDLRVFSAGSTGQIGQELTSCNKTNPVTYVRYFYLDEWGEWKKKVAQGDFLTVTLSSDYTLSATATYETIPFGFAYSQNGSSLSLTSDGGIKVGSGVKSIAISGQAYYYTGTTGQKCLQILINNTVIGRVQLQNVAQYTTIVMPTKRLNITEGDIIYMQFQGTSGDLIKDYDICTQLSAEVIA